MVARGKEFRTEIAQRGEAGNSVLAAGDGVVVEPKPGAGGRVAAGFVARAPADGYTLFMLPGGHAASAAMQEQMN
ncbi:MAG TPA: tripartite tricarboxylate transporter substrate-binding protein, partial [Hyphomicrobiaceae bacterium]|nr:tripartite tricarboxylate transporter substrate-binding protein [Hyphomicrobiaceae bacterium]